MINRASLQAGRIGRGRAVGDDRAGGGGVGGEALRRVRRSGGHPLGAFVTPDVYLSERRFGGGSAAAVADAADGGARGPGRLTHE